MEAKYFGCKVRQRLDNQTCEFFIFIALAKNVRKWAGIKRSEDFSEGTQRTFRKARANAINKFLKADSINTIPNNILIAFNEGKSEFHTINEGIKNCIDDQIDNDCSEQINWGFLTFSYEEDQQDHEKPALIVDGQHRLYGISAFESENLPILIVSLINASLQEQAFQFIVINDKAVRVNQTNAKSIIADIDEPPLIERLLKSGVKYGENTPLLRIFNNTEESPFHQILKWDQNREGQKIVDVSSIEQIASYTKNYLGRYIENDFDSLVDITFTVWKAVKAEFAEFWTFAEQDLNEGQKKFFSKVNLISLHEFLMENLKKGYDFGMVTDIYDSTIVSKFVTERLLKMISPNFWVNEWRVKLKDNTDMRNMIKRNLETTVDNTRMGQSWNRDLDLVRISSENTDEEE